MVDHPVELGIELLANLEYDTVSIATAIDHLETITTDPELQREILDAAVNRGIITRDGTLLTPERGTFVRFESQVTSKDGEFSCRRCGASLSTGYFIQFDAEELGPFGSSCIRKVTGRE